MRNLTIIFILAFILFSCTPNDRVKFEEPQPAAVKESKGFRALRRGHYVNAKHPKKTVEIQKKLITTSRSYQFVTHRKNIESSTISDKDLKNDSILLKYLNTFGGNAIIIGDTVHYSQSVTDTFFMISENNILKHYKRSYYLNFKDKDGFWEVYRLKFQGDTLLFGAITPNDTLLSYDYARVDSVKGHPKVKEYILRPDKKELRKLMRSEAFKFTEKYIKQ